MIAGHVISVTPRRNGREWHVKLVYRSDTGIEYTVNEVKYARESTARNTAAKMAKAYNATFATAKGKP